MASVSFSVVPNPGAARSGSISVAGQRATVTQGAAAPAPCSATISPASQSIGAAGGPGGPIFISTPNTCAWTAVSNASWIAVTSSAGGTGEGQVTFSVAANTGAARNGTLTIAARTFTVAQAAAGAPAASSCVHVLDRSNQSERRCGRGHRDGHGDCRHRLHLDGNEQCALDHDHGWRGWYRQRSGGVQPSPRTPARLAVARSRLPVRSSR